MKALVCLLVLALCFTVSNGQNGKSSKRKAVILADISWVEAKKILGPDTVVVIPVGAEAKEHGPHLPLGTDLIQAEYLRSRIAERLDVVIAPTVNYNYYPSFIEYPGSTHLNVSTSRSFIYDICISLSRYGVRRFYILNTGVSTNVPLTQVAERLKDDGILMRYTDITKPNDAIKAIKKETHGTHANEEETSVMLFISPKSVDMKKAVKDYGIEKGTALGLSPDPNKDNTTYSPSGVFGDATLATREKGEKIMNIELKTIETEIQDMKIARLPVGFTDNQISAIINGKYQISPTETVSFAYDNLNLVVERPGNPRAILVKSGAFKYGSRAFEVNFVRNTEGRVTHALIEINGRMHVAHKVS